MPSLESDSADFQPSGGLVDIDRGVVRVGVPEVALKLDAQGDLDQLDVRLIGGRF